jgi:Domain of unknown function (DUF4340)
MKEMYKTLSIVAVAVLLTGAAVIRIPGRSSTDEAFNDQGKPFFPGFKDPLTCTDLEVVDYDPSTATAARFEVKLKDGKWVIPSHYDYPADAKDRLAKTAGGVMDLTKDTIRSDRVEDQEGLGVIDPLDAKSTSLKGRGKRVTLRDVSEKVLADFIIGKAVAKDKEKESDGADKASQHYVRVPDQKRTYGVNLKVDLSTRFADWIETNLLKIDTGKIRKINFDNYKVDLDQRRVVPGEKLSLERADASGPWTLGGGIPEGQELNSEKVSDLVSALGDLKIVGVRPKPAGLSRDLRTGDKGIRLTDSAILSLQGKGFYPSPDGKLLSNQGDVLVETEEGVVYTLRFGEVNFATGEELSAGSEAIAGKDSVKGKPKDAKKAEGTTESRFLMVTVSFDPSLIPEPKKEAEPPPTKLPEEPFQLAPDDPKRVAQEKADTEKAEKAKADQEKKIDDGKKRVGELTDRFANWYYVTPGSSFRSISMDRPALLKPKGEKPASSAPTMPMMPNFPGGAGFPHP